MRRCLSSIVLACPWLRYTVPKTNQENGTFLLMYYACMYVILVCKSTLKDLQFVAGEGMHSIIAITRQDCLFIFVLVAFYQNKTTTAVFRLKVVDDA